MSAAAQNATAQVQAVFRQYATAFRNRDVDAFMSLCVQDDSLFVFDLTPPRQHVGWDDYRNDVRAFFSKFKPPLEFSIHDLEITVSGDVAYAHSAPEVRGHLINGESVHYIVRLTDVLRRIGGKWLIVQEHISLPIEMPSGKAVLLSQS
jgi:ketosteroid isomerase-like protein